jgi:plasmid stability protein
MASITIKNIPDEIYERLKLMAKLRHRSINSEIIHSLEKSVGLSVEDPRELRKRLAEFREKVGKRGTLSSDEIDKAINEGRP